MFFQLIATFMIGVLGASLAYIAFRISGRRLSKAVIPFAAALAMIGYSVWGEMTWAKRTAAALPATFAHVENGAPVSSPLSPWTYLVPRTDSFRALDRKSVQPLPGSADLVLAQVYELVRYLPPKKSSWVVDCARRQQAEILATTTFDAQGLPSNLGWRAISADSRLADVACNKE